jgi:hypothetical protein
VAAGRTANDRKEKAVRRGGLRAGAVRQDAGAIVPGAAEFGKRGESHTIVTKLVLVVLAVAVV